MENAQIGTEARLMKQGGRVIGEQVRAVARRLRHHRRPATGACFAAAHISQASATRGSGARRARMCATTLAIAMLWPAAATAQDAATGFRSDPEASLAGPLTGSAM